MSFNKLNRKNKHLNSVTLTAVFLAITTLTACGASNSNVASQAEFKKSANEIVVTEDLSKSKPKELDSTITKPKETMEKQITTREDQISLAKQDLTERLELPAAEVTLLTAETVTWRSSALGCPKPNARYMQALTPGVLIVLGAGGKHHRYHGKVNGVVSYCPNDQAESPSSSESDI